MNRSKASAWISTGPRIATSHVKERIMVNQDLLSIFVGLTSLAVLIQTGIVVGLYFVTNKIVVQAERAVDAAHSLTGPTYALAGNLRTVSARLAEASATTRGHLREVEHSVHKTQVAWHERLAARRS